MYKFLLLISLILASQSVMATQQTLILDCSITRANPIFDLADFPEGKFLVQMERYRFSIPIGGGVGLTTTPRANDIRSQVLESETHFQIDFENKRVVIDRMTAEFQVFLKGAQQPLGGGTCAQIGQKKF